MNFYHSLNLTWITDFASRDVILSAGALDTPKIRLHSGIGPAADLESFNIPVVNDLPAIGQGLRDHYFVPLILALNPETNDRNSFFQDPAAMEAAMKQWEDNNTGLWTRYGCQLGSGWFNLTASPLHPNSKHFQHPYRNP